MVAARQRSAPRRNIKKAAAAARNKTVMASLVVAFILLSVLADRSAPQRIVTGTIREFEAGEWLSIAIYRTDPKGFPIALSETTAYEGSPTAIKTGARVAIWYRSVGERRFVADKVRVLPDLATR
jgi:hypothetical protein